MLRGCRINRINRVQRIASSLIARSKRPLPSGLGSVHSQQTGQFSTGPLRDKVVVITGASSGIGEAISLICARHGAKLLLAARRTEQLNDLSGRCVSAGARDVCVQRVDVSREEDCKLLIEQAMQKYGSIDLLILNAGVGQSFFLETLNPEFNYRQFMDINYYGCVYPTIAALPHLSETSGRICVVSSIGGLVPFPRQTFYNASKYALMGFFESLRLELMSKKSGVSITMVCPGFVKTNITEGGGLGRDGKPVGTSARSLGIPMMSSEACAELAVAGAINRDKVVVAPKWYRLLVALRSLAPSFVDNMIVKNFAPNKKPKSS